MRKSFSAKTLLLASFVAAQVAGADDSIVSPKTFSDYLKSRFEICDAIAGSMIAAKTYLPESYDWKLVENCVETSKENASIKYKNIRSKSEPSGEERRSLNNLLAYWQASMDLLKYEEYKDILSYSRVINERKAVIDERINLFLLDAAL